MAHSASKIRFQATLRRPGGKDKGAPWSFLNLPKDASEQLPSRSMQSVDGTFNGVPFFATLEPDGLGGHWLRVKPELREVAGVQIGDVVELEVAPVKEEPEPEVPADLQEALAAAVPKARETWSAITALARRDWIFWIVSGKKAETRLKRIEVAISKLSAGNRRPCCFDRSGMYDKSLSCPVADDES
jgi:hypothetical protein